MANWVGFDEVKAQVSIEQILERYNLLGQLHEKGNQLIGLCPFHSDSRTPSFKVTPGRKIWNCFGCNLGGDTIDLVIQFEGYTEGDRTANRRKAALLIQEWYGVVVQRPASKRRSGKPDRAKGDSTTESVEDERVRDKISEAAAEGETETEVNPPLTFELKNLDPDHPYLRERGLTVETITTFGLGYYAGKGSMHGRIVIPIHNEHGELIAYAGRWPGDSPEDEPKYRLPANFRKSLVLYNLHRSREHATEGLIVVEGFFNLFELWQKGRRNVVAVMGSSVSAEQEKLIVETVRQIGGNKCRVLLAFDPDDAGRKGMQEAAACLVSQVFVRTVELSI